MIRSYPERIAGRLPKPFWWSWFIFWLAVFFVDFLLARGGVSNHSRLTELGVTMFCASVSISLGLSARIMSGLFQDIELFIDFNSHDLNQWYDQKLKWIYQGVWPLISGALFCLVVEWTFGSLINSYNPDGDVLLFFRMTYRLLGFFILGMCLWSLVNVLLLPSQLLKFKFKLQLNNFSGIGLQALGGAFLKMSLLTIFCLLIFVCTVFVSPLHANVYVLLWIGIGTLLIFLFFLLPQLGIHQIMANEKRVQLRAFSTHLGEAMKVSQAEPNLENMQKLRELFELQKYLKDLNDWPFNVTALWQLVSALLIPILLVILQIIFKI